MPSRTNQKHLFELCVAENCSRPPSCIQFLALAESRPHAPRGTPPAPSSSGTPLHNLTTSIAPETVARRGRERTSAGRCVQGPKHLMGC
jgi:hypothetical protein